MRQARTLDEFLKAPVGQYLAGPNFLGWCSSPTLIGSKYWGPLRAADLEGLTPVWDVLVRHATLRPPIDNVIDAREVEGLDIDGHQWMLDYLAGRVLEFGRLIRHLVLLVRPGLPGTLVAGLYSALGPKHPLSVVGNLDDAEKALGRSDFAAVQREVESVVIAQRPLDVVAPRLFDQKGPEPPMRPATVEEFLAAPVGRYVAGRSFVVWAFSPTLAGSAYFGRPDEADFPSLLALYALPNHPDLRPPFDVIVDCGALRWLGRADGETSIRAIDAILDGAQHLSPFLRQLRAHLAAHLDAPRLDEVAHSLGFSDRSLQRRLLELGTTFRDELERARVCAAEALLVDTDDKLGAIARQVGCSSLPHFSAWFRRVTGEAPSDFRTRRRAQCTED